MLDRDAVAKTLKELSAAQAARDAVDPAEAEERARAIAAMESLRSDPNEQWSTWTRRASHGGLGTDLLSASIGFIFGGLLGRSPSARRRLDVGRAPTADPTLRSR